MITICLSMICRNEAHVIARCLRSVRPHITHWAINDTGSTDGTQDIIRRELAGLPGELIEREWVDDFAHSRNQALDLARANGAQYAMFLDADEVLEAPPNIPSLTTLPARFDNYVADNVWPIGACKKDFLVRITPELRWKHAIHEWLHQGREISRPDLGGVRILNFDDGVSSRDPAGKARHRAEVLERLIANEPDCVDKQMHNWYLGREYVRFNDLDRAIASYQLSAEMPYQQELRFLSRFSIACLMMFNRREKSEIVFPAIERVIEACPARPEGPLLKAMLLNRDGQHAAAEGCARSALLAKTPPHHMQFPLGDSLRRWRAQFEIAVAASGQGRLDEAFELLADIADKPADLVDRDRIRTRMVGIRDQIRRTEAHAQ